MKKFKFLLVIFFIIFSGIKIYGKDIGSELEIEQLEEILKKNFSSPNIGVQIIYNENNNLIKNGEKYYYFSLIYGGLMGEKPKEEVPTEVFINGITQDIYEVKQISSRKIFVGRILIKSNIKLITDILNWKHPTKNVFKKYEIKLNRVEIIENYPIFYTKFKKKTSNNEMEKILEELLKANGYWDFEIKDEFSKKCIKIFGDKENKKLDQYE